MTTEITVIEVSAKEEPRVDSRLLADRLGNQHATVIRLIDEYKNDFESLGVLRFKIDKPGAKSKGGRPEKLAMLTEDQAYFLLTLSRNSRKVRSLKIELVKAFARFRQNRQTEADYIPYYSELHDAVKTLADHAHQHGSMTDERLFHINFNKLINKTFRLEAGQRQCLPGHLRAMVTAANLVAKNAIEGAILAGLDHHQAYAAAKHAVQSLAAITVPRIQDV